MKGLRTVLFGLLVAIAPSAIEHLAHVDWTEFGLSPAAGAFIGSIIIGLRAITTTPIFKK